MWRISQPVIGIDPGASGGIAIIADGIAEAWKIPETERDLYDILAGLPTESRAYLEKVHAMPKQGVTSVFSFGRTYGFLRGCLISLQIPFEDVTPQRWQKHLGCMTGGDKNVSKARAQQLFPYIRVTHALADALLIAEYGTQMRGESQ